MAIEVPKDVIPAEVELVGLDGNAHSIIGAVADGLRKAGNSREVIKHFRTQAMAGDYDHLLQVAIAYTESVDS